MLKRCLNHIKPNGYGAFIIPCIWLKPDKENIYHELTSRKILYLKTYDCVESNKLFNYKCQTPVCYVIFQNTFTPLLNIWDKTKFVDFPLGACIPTKNITVYAYIIFTIIMTTLTVQGHSILNDVSATNLELATLNTQGQTNLNDVSAINMELYTLNSLNTTIGTLGVTGLATFSGGINADNFSVADGITTITGELRVNGISADNFSVADTNGNTIIGGTLDVSGLATFSGISADNFSVADGITTITGELRANGIKCDTDKFVVADTTGNTTIAGTLDVSGVVTFNSNIISTRFQTIKVANKKTYTFLTGTTNTSVTLKTNVVLGGGTQFVKIEICAFKSSVGLGTFTMQIINGTTIMQEFPCPYYFARINTLFQWSRTFRSNVVAGTYSITFTRNATDLISAGQNDYLDITIMEMPY